MWRIPLGLLVGLLILLPVWWPAPFGEGDHLIFWAAGHSIVAGGSPYDRDVWVGLAESYPSTHLQDLASSGHEIWVYPPWTGFLFVPFGLLPLDLGLWALHGSYIAASIAATMVLINMVSWRTASVRTLVTLLAITFQPLVIAAQWGQFTSWTLLGAVVVIAALRRTSAGQLVVGAILAVAKPQYAALPGLAVVAVLVRRRAWRALLFTTAALLATAIVTIALQPRALEAIFAGAGQRAGAFDSFPTTWGLARLLAPEDWPILLAMLLATGILACVVAVWSAARERRDEVLVSASLALGVILTPYALTYEHSLLLPAFVSAAFAADRCGARTRAALLSTLVLLCALAWGIFIFAKLFSTHALLGFLPVATVTLFAAAQVAARGSVADMAATPIPSAATPDVAGER